MHDEFEFGSPEWAEAIYKGDKDHLDPADVVVAVIDYDNDNVWSRDSVGNWLFWGNSKPVILVKEKEGAINLMMSVPAHAVVTDVADIATYDFDELPASKWTGKAF